MRVINAVDTASYCCTICDSWIDHWAKNSGSSIPKYCVVEGCSNPPEVGAHVELCDLPDQMTYIFPFCQKHNKSKNILEICDSFIFVKAMKLPECK